MTLVLLFGGFVILTAFVKIGVRRLFRGPSSPMSAPKPAPAAKTPKATKRTTPRATGRTTPRSTTPRRRPRA